MAAGHDEERRRFEADRQAAEARRDAAFDKYGGGGADRAFGGSLREAVAMDAACNMLVEAGLVRAQFARAGETKGRAARKFEVNAQIVGGAQ
jgi:hypothetical protein